MTKNKQHNKNHDIGEQPTSTTSMTSGNKKAQKKEDKSSKVITAKKEQKSKNNTKKSKKDEKEKIKPKTKGWTISSFVESILVDSSPAFLLGSKGSLKPIRFCKEIFDGDTKCLPITEEHHGYTPYSFTKKELDSLIENPPTKEELLDEIKEQIDKFLVLDEQEKYIVSGDVLLSYCQEWIDTVHYLFFVGENGSGKSSCCRLFGWLGYRCLYSEDISVANIYNFLGKDEEGAGTIAEDEAHELDEYREKLRIYKNGYSKGARIPKIFVGSNSKVQEFYKSFCFKVFGGEYIPKNKGFRQRLVPIHTVQGTPKSYIKQPTKQEKKELLQLRKKLLFWKVYNTKKGIKIIDSGFNGRDKELWEGFLSCVHGTKYYEKCKEAAESYVEKSHETIKNSLEAIIFKKILRLLKDDKVDFQDLWIDIINRKDELDGYTGAFSKTFYMEEHGGKITYNSLSSMLEEKFKAKKLVSYQKGTDGKKNKKTSYKLKKEILQRLSKQYQLPSS